MTLGSLFDGISGFPLAGIMHGIEPLWASEIEPFPILVTRKRCMMICRWRGRAGALAMARSARLRRRLKCSRLRRG